MDGDGNKKSWKSVDFCNLTPFERQKVRDSWRAVPKSPHVYLGETPTLVRKTPFGLSVPALKAKCTPHIELLAQPRYSLPKIHYVTRAEREAQKELEEEMTKEELKWLRRKVWPVTPTGVKKSALSGKTTPRIDALALAKLGLLKCVKENYFSKLSQAQKNSVNRKIKEHYELFSAKYPPDSDQLYQLVGGVLVHTGCAGKSTEKRKGARFICELDKNQRKNFRRRMKQLGLPKKLMLPDKGPDRGPKKKVKEFEPWLTIISQPKFNVLNEKPYDPFKVKSSAKFYMPTERILIMARPKEIPPPPPLLDYEGNELPPRREWSYTSRRRIVASPRTIELAAPRFVKKKAVNDVKEDPFAVLRRALTAFCSARTKELAEPRQR